MFCLVIMQSLSLPHIDISRGGLLFFKAKYAAYLQDDKDYFCSNNQSKHCSFVLMFPFPYQNFF